MNAGRFDPLAFLRWLDECGVRYLLIGGQAVRLYGSDRTTIDYDFWVAPAARKPVLEFLEETFQLELSSSPSDNKPIVSAVSDLDKVDLFFVRGMTPSNGMHLDFDLVLSASKTVRSEGEPPVRVPSIPHLIQLKQMRPRPNPADLQDLQFLRVLESTIRE